MLRFESDYLEGAHPKLLEQLVATNLEQTPGYSEDRHCENARRLIRQACNSPDSDVHFLVGGTQANLTVIASALRPHQGVICAHTGHINTHESGAIEATGHKVLPMESADGKLTAGQIQAICEAHWNDSTREHTVQPGMVYISHPTENGTTYTKSELTAIRDVCASFGLTLYLDGARLGYALVSPGCDLTLPDIAQLCDVFYIGGTKVGALFGEAVVITQASLKRDFRYLIKQRGGMLAKGRLLGVQFEALFQDGLYFDISRHAVTLALKLRSALLEKGFKLLYDSCTNQQFPILSDCEMHKLGQKYTFSLWQQMGDTRTAVRFCTSWATKAEHVDALIDDIKAL